jgi:transposase InsO family protein
MLLHEICPCLVFILFNQGVLFLLHCQKLDVNLVPLNPSSGCIHHSDRGVQYASHQYVEHLTHNGFQISMSRKGNPYDNAIVETFWKSLKYEEVHLWNYETYGEVLERLSFFIEEVYNKK